MKRNVVTFLALIAGILAACGSLSAHDVTSAYDEEHPVTMTGTLTQLWWANPHFSTGIGNDPVLHCDPAGFPKALVMDFPFEMAHIRGHWNQFLENQHAWREIWTMGERCLLRMRERGG